MKILIKLSPLPFLAILCAPFWSVSYVSLMPLFILFGILVFYQNVGHLFKKWAVIFFVMLQYPLWNMINIYLHANPSATITTFASTNWMWLWQASLSIVLLLYFLNAKSISHFFELLAPWIVIGTCVAAGIVYISTGVCRIALMTPIVFTPPMMATTLTLLYIGRTRMGSKQVCWKTLAMIMATMLLSTAFSGTRGIFLAQFCAYGAMILMFLKPSPRAAASIGVAVILGAALGYAIDGQVGCSFSSRSLVMLKGTEDMISEDGSIRLRLLMWASAWDAITQAPIAGLGPLAEPSITQPGYTHVHNMYFSWMIWGGILSLISGLIFLFSPLFSIILRLPIKNVLFATISTSVFWAASMVVDSFLVWPHYSFMYTAFFALALRLASDVRTNT